MIPWESVFAVLAAALAVAAGLRAIRVERVVEDLRAECRSASDRSRDAFAEGVKGQRDALAASKQTHAFAAAQAAREGLHERRWKAADATLRTLARHTAPGLDVPDLITGEDFRPPKG